jgi:hypothetical protein
MKTMTEDNLFFTSSGAGLMALDLDGADLKGVC